ncbi:MAG: cupredoxin domain-containing protein [Candidatus Limnocylindria bacterium]
MQLHPLSRSPRPHAALVALPALVLVLAACSSGGSGSQAPASATPGGGTSVTLSGLAFSVAEITVPVGPLTFVNKDGVTHILAEGENGVEVVNPRVQKVSINGGTQGDLVFTVAGDYHITCLVHATMNMEVHVQ